MDRDPGHRVRPGGVPSGFPPETDSYNDAVLLARCCRSSPLPVSDLGVWQARKSLRQPKSAPNLPFVIRLISNRSLRIDERH